MDVTNVEDSLTNAVDSLDVTNVEDSLTNAVDSLKAEIKLLNDEEVEWYIIDEFLLLVLRI